MICESSMGIILKRVCVCVRDCSRRWPAELLLRRDSMLVQVEGTSGNDRNLRCHACHA